MNETAKKISEDVRNIQSGIQEKLNAFVCAASVRFAKIEFYPDINDKYHYTFKVRVGPSFPVNLTSFVYAYGWSKIQELQGDCTN